MVRNRPNFRQSMRGKGCHNLGGGCYLTKFNTRGGALRSNPLPFYIHCIILAEKVPILYTFY